MDSNQNNETGKPATDIIADNEQIILPADIPPPASSENQSPPSEITPPQTQPPMEVHHHGHVHEKKKWKEYLFQFLMLFLAVFCGFLAEYQLEHKIEKDRGKAYMNSMLEDLKSDSAQLSANVLARMKRVEIVDSLIFLLSSVDYHTKLNDIYYYGRSLTLNIDFFPNDRTILQLKNSGSLRLVHNPLVSNSIMNYDQKMRSLVFLLTQEQQQRMEIRRVSGAVFNGVVFNSMVDNYEMIKKPENNPALFNHDAAAINDLIIQAQYLKKVDMNQVKKAKELGNLAEGLIELIKKEYDFE